MGVASERGPRRGTRNRYIDVDFSSANLRGTIYRAAAFERCIFANSNISKVNFGQSTFTDCRFEGELREVQFWRTRPLIEGEEKDLFPPNEMSNVDFRRAKLHWVEFRGLTLDTVQLPNDSDHIIIEDFAVVLDKLIAALKFENPDQTTRVLLAVFEVDRKWAAPHGRGVWNRQDFAENGEEELARVLDLLDRVGAKTSLNTRVN